MSHAYIRYITAKVTAVDGTSVTLVPVVPAGPQSPTAIVVSFAATPAQFAVGDRVLVRIDR